MIDGKDGPEIFNWKLNCPEVYKVNTSPTSEKPTKTNLVFDLLEM